MKLGRNRAPIAILVGSFACSNFARAASEFGGLLDRLAAVSRERSPDVQSAQELAKQKSAQSYTAWTQWLPRASLVGSATRAKDNSLLSSGSLPPIFTGFEPQETDLYRWSLNVDWALFNRGVWLNVAQSRQENRFAQLQSLARETEHEWRFRESLGKFLLAAYRESVLSGSLGAAKERERDAKVRFDLGKTTRVDVLKAQSNLASLESRLIAQHQLVRSARDAFLDYSGLREDELESLGLNPYLNDEKTLLASLEAFFEGTDGLLKRVDPYLKGGEEARAGKAVSSGILYRSSIAEEGASGYRAGNLFASEWPQLALQGSYGKQAQDWDALTRGDAYSYSVGLVLSIPLFSWGSSWSAWREAEAAGTQARIKGARDRRNLLRDVENEALLLQSLLKARDANRSRVNQDEEIVRLTARSYQLGKADLIEWLSAQESLLASKADLAESSIQLAVEARRFAWHLGVDRE